MAATTRCAAAGLSRAMYSASASRITNARFSQRTSSGLPCTRLPGPSATLLLSGWGRRPLAGPLPHYSSHLLFAGELPSVRLLQRLLDLLDLPLVNRDVLADGFRRHERS